MATSANQLAKSGKFGDLRRRLVFLVLALVVYRIGAPLTREGALRDLQISAPFVPFTDDATRHQAVFQRATCINTFSGAVSP